MKKLIAKVARCIYAVYCSLAFVLLFLLVFPFFVFFIALGKKGEMASLYLFNFWTAAFFFLSVMPVRITGREWYDKDKPYVLVANHHSWLDTPMIYRAVNFPIKTLARADIAKVPLFGYLYRHFTILVDRTNQESKAHSVHQMIQTIKKEKTSIFIFPEGSFNETDKPLKAFYDGAFKIAIDTNTPILPLLFPDTVKRWHYSSFWRWTPGLSRAVFLPPINPEDIVDVTPELLKEEVWQHMNDVLQQLD